MHHKRIIFFGLSGILKQAVSYLEELNKPFLIYTDQVQSAKWDTLLPHVSKEKLKIVNAIEEFNIAHWEEGDIGISIGAPWFFSLNFIQRFPKGMIFNLHGSQLPMYRGGNIFSWFVLNGVRTGVCLLHYLTQETDAGPVVKYEEFLYPSSCRKPADYIRCYEERNASFLQEFIHDVFEGSEKFVGGQQPEYLSTYWPRLKSDINGWIDWNLEGILVERFVTAFDEPYDGARTRYRGKVVTLKDVCFQPGFNYHPFQNGIIIRNNGRWLTVSVTGGELIVSMVASAEGPIKLSSIKPGDRFTTSVQDLERAKKRVIKGKKGFNVQPDIN